jgi:sterol desaturase/sphingolipid hydroxylase (fatty acid hydroxylase superfamily)
MYAIPGFLVLILIEWFFSSRKKVTVYNVFDTVSSLSSGMTNSIKDVLGLSVIIISYSWFYEQLAIFQIQTTWITVVIAFICLDFAGYWSHRFEHSINLFWNRHIIHHSSEEFNLACALRQNISAIFAIFTFLLIPAALLGVPPKVIGIVAPLHLFAQFWYHTRLIDKMGILEYILVTPSHHRVHHAINDQYIDKNFSQIFIIWDKLFGTFQAELEEEPPVYGVKKQLNTWNPILINFSHLWGMLQDAWRTKSFVDKLKIFFMPTGWRPQDVMDKYPIAYVDQPHQMIKYSSNESTLLKIWSIVQFIITISLMIHLFSQIDQYALVWLIMYGLFLMLNIYSYTSIMDMTKHALFVDTLKIVLIISVGIYLGSWYNIPLWLMALYSGLSFAINSYFIFLEFRWHTDKTVLN